MTQYPLINAADVEPLDAGAAFEFKLPITGRHGSSTAAFHARFRPGAGFGGRLHRNCDIIAVHLTGTGVATRGDLDLARRLLAAGVLERDAVEGLLAWQGRARERGRTVSLEEVLYERGVLPRGDGVSGELVVTSLSSVSPRLTGTLGRFQKEYPDLIVRYLTGDEVLRLEYGEAHVAVRAGNAPDNPDNVVQPFVKQKVNLFASRDYIAAHGRPESFEEMRAHNIVASDNFGSRAPFMRWLLEHVEPEQITFRGSDYRVIRDAILEGFGVGFLSEWEAERFPSLVKLFDTQDEWLAPLWLVTHVDLHRTTKVQTFLKFLKEDAKSW